MAGNTCPALHVFIVVPEDTAKQILLATLQGLTGSHVAQEASNQKAWDDVLGGTGGRLSPLGGPRTTGSPRPGRRRTPTAGAHTPISFMS